jgi:hypothetical protein
MCSRAFDLAAFHAALEVHDARNGPASMQKCRVTGFKEFLHAQLNIVSSGREVTVSIDETGHDGHSARVNLRQAGGGCGAR